ncbi:hypothetical protein RB195_010184 [Necator americanus]|uniref:CUB domain-containing protein n=1 Tax=Necator americanus TaxID=51031 RepID=A0ABR1CYN2_NECAM
MSSQQRNLTLAGFNRKGAASIVRVHHHQYHSQQRSRWRHHCRHRRHYRQRQKKSRAVEQIQVSTTATTDTSASSAAGSKSTVSTTTPTTTTAGTTTLPPVDVNYVEFTRRCSSGSCQYILVAPHNNQTVMAMDQAEFESDSYDVQNISLQVQNYSDSLSSSTTYAQGQINNLSTELQEAQNLLAGYQTDLDGISGNLTTAEIKLKFSSDYISFLSLNPQMCYYKCIGPAPTTPAPSTTTIPPSTAPSPCSNFTCPSGSCNLDNFNNPYCDSCLGNLDGYKQCGTGSCSSAGITVTTEPDTREPFFSPGYYNTTDVLPQDNSITCTWILYSSNGASGYNASELDFSGLDTITSSLVFYSPNGATITANNKFNQKKLQLALSATPVTIQFTASKDSKSWFKWYMMEA